MNSVPIELCERKSYYQAMKLLKKEVRKSGPPKRLDNFIKFIKRAKNEGKKVGKPKFKLSFEVSIKFTFFKES